ncbi:DUF5786 family protein [Natronobiforma cellulositropha]|uniref:DUF5786 family protein n=1 Tax=Natronobiforma cellulositropha TaxID=1679076 RepID=UPI0021D58AE7|nr:DUF5786 family protein [Natronobiforma cellulositropha]
MGFGSYDESEQREVETDFDDDDAVRSEENPHEGTLEFDNGASSGELLAKLAEIKDEGDDAA